MFNRIYLRALVGLACAVATLPGSVAAQALDASGETGQEPPELARECRAAWIASVSNIDWPSRPGLPVERQKAELQALLDRAVSLRLNAVILQIRPACDALYASPREPWSEYLTGRQGTPPEPLYDPLAFAVEEAHARGLELHAWLNPYRARVLEDGQSDPAPQHISVSKPHLVKRYGRYLWLDPGESEVQEHSLGVIMDVVKRYDVDAIHMDDYFYPYREPVIGLDGKQASDAKGKPLYIPFPDDASYARYQTGGGKLARDDWRRDNVNRFVKRLYQAIKLEKPGVKLGISPFGIWKAGHPAQIKGMSQYDAIYADARLWLARGWVDYFAPQLYWSIENPDQSYPILLKWWVEQNTHQRHIWPGLFTSRVREAGDRGFVARQIAYQINWTRLQPGASGHIHFSIKAMADEPPGVGPLLRGEAYKLPALMPATPWLAGKPPAVPRLAMAKDAERQALNVTISPRPGTVPWLWTVYARQGGRWKTEIAPATRVEWRFPLKGPEALEALHVAGVDRQAQEGPRARMVIQATADASVTPRPLP
ncbi:MAG: family 10 glycosylhydrolase [Candidatus Sericytochromatia bacterium]|nr:family 10 glycosylhydrolase [Candidatus Sericytochromatia bacterium]